MRVREQHHQSVDSDSLARRGRQSVAERANVVVVHFFGSFLPALFHLRAEPPLLVHGIIQLREAVREFHPRDEQLETLRQ